MSYSATVKLLIRDGIFFMPDTILSIYFKIICLKVRQIWVSDIISYSIKAATLYRRRELQIYLLHTLPELIHTCLHLLYHSLVDNV